MIIQTAYSWISESPEEVAKKLEEKIEFKFVLYPSKEEALLNMESCPGERQETRHLVSITFDVLQKQEVKLVNTILKNPPISSEESSDLPLSDLTF